MADASLLVRWAFAALAVLQALDAYTTWHVLRLGGRERNPVVLWLMQRLGIGWALALAKGGTVVCGVVLALGDAWPINLVMLVALCVFYLAVVVGNFKALRAQRAIAEARDA